MTPQLDKKDLISGLQEALPVETLFHPDIISGPTILYRVLWYYLVIQGHIYTPYPNKQYISYVVANSFFTHPDDRDYAIEILMSLRKPSTQDPPGTPCGGIGSLSTTQSGYINRNRGYRTKIRTQYFAKIQKSRG